MSQWPPEGAYWSDSHLALYVGNCLHMDAIPDGSVHCVVTSPPYLSKRKYKTEPLMWPDGWRGHLGLEPSPEMFIGHLIEIFREVKRVLRQDGTVWVNLGDTHAGSGGAGGDYAPGGLKEGQPKYPGVGPVNGLPPGDLIGIPWRFALAMQQDGWRLRQDIIWQKPAPMPESCNGVRWERHRVKVGYKKAHFRGRAYANQNDTPDNSTPPSESANQDIAQWADCPGCPECAPNDGLVLRRGNWRPTASHEYIFMFAKSDHYYSDREAVKEIATYPDDKRRPLGSNGSWEIDGRRRGENGGGKPYEHDTSGRNKRSVWTIGPEPFKGAHFATFPTELPSICIRASTSEAGVCPKCGSQWARVVKASPEYAKMLEQTSEGWFQRLENPFGDKKKEDNTFSGISPDYETLGWRATCSCGKTTTVPATILDPFAGTFTTGLAAKRLGRRAIGYELSTEYAELAIDRNRQAGLL